MKNNAEVVIIGGGIIGCATAYYLAKMGTQVIVLEGSDHIGNGGSSRNGGGVRQSGRDVRELPLVMYGIQNLWPTLSEELEVDCEYHQDGNLRLGKTEEHAKILTRLADNARSVGLDVRMIDGDEVRRINPYLSEEVTVASWCPTDGHANPLTTTLGYYKMARRLGVRFITGEKVTEAEPPMFNQMLGTAEADFYGHQTKHGSFVFGGSSGMERYNKDNGTPITNSKTAPCICRGLMKYFPNLANAKIVRTWAGWMLPQMGFQPLEKWMRYRDYMWHVPLMVMDLVLLRQLAKLIITGKTDVDLTALRYDRFKAKI